MKFSELIARLRSRGVEIVESRGDAELSAVADDSRRIAPGGLFVARAGSRQSGSTFIADALARGASAILSQDAIEPNSLSPQVAFARVADANLACALAAHELAGHPTAGITMIAVTGTKGKTTVAYLLRSVLKAAGAKVGMIGTVEIDDGNSAVPADMTTPGSIELVALFERMRAAGVTHCVMEVSSHALHQQRVAGIHFAVAIFTNLTGDHLDYHKTMDEYAAAKAVLFAGLDTSAYAVVNADDPWCERILRDCRTRATHIRIVDGHALVAGPKSTLQAAILRMSSGSMQLAISSGTQAPRELVTPLVGRHNAYNLLSVIAAARLLDLDDAVTFRTLQSAAGAPGRLQRVAVRDHAFQVFVDYAHTHDALENVLTALRATMSSGRLICLFGCGGDRDRTKRPRMARIAEALADRVFLTSDNPRTENPTDILNEVSTGFSDNWRTAGKISVEPDRRAAIRAAISAAHTGDIVLIAGKGHENYQIIGTTRHHFDDVEEAQAALTERAL